MEKENDEKEYTGQDRIIFLEGVRIGFKKAWDKGFDVGLEAAFEITERKRSYEFMEAIDALAGKRKNADVEFEIEQAIE